MANVFISPTRFTPRGTNNSIPKALAVGWPSSMPLRMEGSASTRNSSCKARIIEFIRSIWRVEIPRAIRIVFREQFLVTGDAVRVGRFSWDQSRHGLVVRGSARSAGAEPSGSASGAAAYCVGARALNWEHYRGGPDSADESGALGAENWGGSASVCLWYIQALSFPSSELGGNEGGISRPDSLV